MFNKQHTAPNTTQGGDPVAEAGQGGILTSPVRSPLIHVSVPLEPETRTALHHMAGAANTTVPRLLRQLIEDAVNAKAA